VAAGDECIDQRDSDLTIFAIELFEIAEAFEERNVLDRFCRRRVIVLADESTDADAKELR
jgi:hypothetical protein